MRIPLPIVIVVMCSCPGLIASQDLVVKPRWRTNGPETSPFTSIGGVGRSPSGDIWVVDTREATVHILSVNGEFVKTIGRRGDGPGEFRAPRLISFAPSSDRIAAVMDLSRRSIEIFDLDGEFLKRVSHGMPIFSPKSFHILPDRSFLISGGMTGAQETIHIISEEGQLMRSLGSSPRADDTRARLHLSGGPVMVLPSGGLIHSVASRHEILAVSPTGQEALLAREDTVIPATGDDFIFEIGNRTYYRWDYPRSTGLFSLPNGNFLNVITWGEKGVSIWEEYLPTGELLRRGEVPSPYQAWSLLPDGELLLSLVDMDTGESFLFQAATVWKE